MKMKIQVKIMLMASIISEEKCISASYEQNRILTISQEFKLHSTWLSRILNYNPLTF
jgi:hypothetical protein